MKKIYLRLICLILSVLLMTAVFSGCSHKSDDKDDETFRVVTSFYPMYVFTKNITDGAKGVVVENMTDTDAGCLHDYQLLPRDLKLLEKADLFVINGAGMENFISKVIDSTENLEILTTSDSIEFINEDSYYNPHVWMYIPNAVIQIDNITEKLCLMNPENSEIYKENCKKYTEKLDVLNAKFMLVSGKFSNRNIVVTHGTFDYMAKYNLNIVGRILDDHDAKPSAATISKLSDLAKQKNVAAIFTEPQYSESSVQVISKEADVPVYTLNPMVTGNKDEYLGVYEKIMEENIRILESALN